MSVRIRPRSIYIVRDLIGSRSNRSAYQLRRAFPDSEITPMRLYAYPFPVVMVSVTDRSLRLYERKHIAKQNGADYKLLTVPELSAPAYQAWHTREVKGTPCVKLIGNSFTT